MVNDLEARSGRTLVGGVWRGNEIGVCDKDKEMEELDGNFCIYEENWKAH